MIFKAEDANVSPKSKILIRGVYLPKLPGKERMTAGGGTVQPQCNILATVRADICCGIQSHCYDASASSVRV